jgi:hypothetical protein
MVFGVQKLQDKVFCLTEERDFFQGKYLEQVSALASLKEEIRLAKREIERLRKQVLSNETSNNSSKIIERTPTKERRQTRQVSNPDGDDQASTASCSCSSLSNGSASDDDVNEDDDNVNKDERADIRQSAEKLLQWASYRSSVYNNTTPKSTDQTPSIFGNESTTENEN